MIMMTIMILMTMTMRMRMAMTIRTSMAMTIDEDAPQSAETIRTALAMGADRGIHIEVPLEDMPTFQVQIIATS